MLATHGQPFDSEAHFFEYKWDGFRAAAMIEGGGLRLVSRNGLDLTDRFPSVAELAGLPDGLALDGELVGFRDGKPDFEMVLSRSRSRTGAGARAAAIRFVAFDILYETFESTMGLPFTERRASLERIVKAADCPALMLSEGVAGAGRALYQRACEQSLEGVMAKKLTSIYAAGKRNGSWIKIKRRLKLQAVIIGYIEKEGDDFQSILVASNGIPGKGDGPLQYIGRVGGGFTEAARAQLNALLRAHPRAEPLVTCGERGRWVEPRLFCTVSFAEMTAAGLLRAPVFEGLIEA
jgi:bifunctional non-homologous end joining protein LigD